MITSEETRSQALLEAQGKAENLFKKIEEKKFIQPGRSEQEINQLIYQLADEMYQIKKYWHKRIVRAGANTLLPYHESPPDLVVQENDIVFLDLGPVFEDWEADFGRTFVIGNDAEKEKLKNDIESAFKAGKKYFKENLEVTGSELFHFVEGLAHTGGWEFGGEMAGHLIGQFPHERIPGNKVDLYIHPKNPNKIRSLDENNLQRHWILEVHFVNRKHQFGGFFEELLTVG